MELFVSAGEASSDTHCAHLIRELEEITRVRTFGLGGDELARTGTRLLMHNKVLAGAGGPLEVIGQLPQRRRLKHALKTRLAKMRPDAAVLVDTGEINLSLAPLLRRFGVPTVYFIPPKLWVWRSGRLATIARNIDLVLSILPFEEQIYAKRNIPFQYVGNPLLDEVSWALTQQQAKLQLGIEPQQPVVTVLPGSRHNEIRLQLDIFIAAVRQFLHRVVEFGPPPLILVPAAQAIDVAALTQAFRAGLPGAEIRIVKGQSHACMKCARAGLIKSGTSTLEAALLQVPMVLAYHSSRSAEWVFRHIVRYQGYVGLVNLFLEPNPQVALGVEGGGAPVVPEMILDRCRPDLIAEKLIGIYRDGPAREQMLTALARVPVLLAPPPHLGKSPMQAAAHATWELLIKKNAVPN